MIVQIRAKGQMTLPSEVRKQAHLEEGDLVEVTVGERGEIVLHPKKLIDADQAWFWTEEWQKGEREASEDLREGRFERHETAGDFMKALED